MKEGEGHRELSFNLWWDNGAQTTRKRKWQEKRKGHSAETQKVRKPFRKEDEAIAYQSQS